MFFFQFMNLEQLVSNFANDKKQLLKIIDYHCFMDVKINTLLHKTRCEITLWYYNFSKNRTFTDQAVIFCWYKPRFWKSLRFIDLLRGIKKLKKNILLNFFSQFFKLILVSNSQCFKIQTTESWNCGNFSMTLAY